ncbi:hypothetical protein, partial [Bradyrhizobium pachyrhizi]|uniref:hypothetical protein n=1 Tax=Bradyrhizobium pachyrhizi TaxID=280333 RepID=UPI0024C039AF
RRDGYLSPAAQRVVALLKAKGRDFLDQVTLPGKTEAPMPGVIVSGAERAHKRVRQSH